MIPYHICKILNYPWTISQKSSSRTVSRWKQASPSFSFLILAGCGCCVPFPTLLDPPVWVISPLGPGCRPWPAYGIQPPVRRRKPRESTLTKALQYMLGFHGKLEAKEHREKETLTNKSYDFGPRRLGGGHVLSHEHTRTKSHTDLQSLSWSEVHTYIKICPGSQHCKTYPAIPLVGELF